MKNEDNFLDTIHSMASRINDFQKLQYKQSLEEVHQIIENKIEDRHRIETCLDTLLELAVFSDGLDLFKTLLRYTFVFDKELTADYIYSYRELSSENQ